MHDELAPLAQSRAGSADATAVHLDEPPHDGQADAQTALGASVRTIRLYEKVEDVRQDIGRETDAIVADAHDDRVVLSCRDELDLSFAPRELGGVVEQVGEHLRQPNQISLHRNRLDG